MPLRKEKQSRQEKSNIFVQLYSRVLEMSAPQLREKMSDSSQKGLKKGKSKAFLMEKTARWIAEHALEKEKEMRRICGYDPERYSFLWSKNHQEHALFKEKVAEYIKSPPPPLPQEPPLVLSKNLFLDLVLRKKSPSFKVGIPKGMMRKELGIIKFLAQFTARYGWDFLNALWNRVCFRTEFQFLNRKDKRYMFYSNLVIDYSSLITTWENTPKSSDKARMDSLLESFFAAFKKKQEEEEEEENEVVDKVVTDRDDFVVNDEYFADVEKNRPQIEEPESKRRKFDQSQHTISVFVTGGRIITIMVQSFLDNVASLKEKIAEEIGIPVDKQKLIGKRGVLLEDDVSLAHYNLGAGDILILGW